MKIGIITLHKVPNYGSALQAYALQYYLKRSTNYDVELIDYIYPNKFHFKQESILQKAKRTLKKILTLFNSHQIQKRKRFQLFYSKYFHLSPKQYRSIHQIYTDPPIYDIYITGSDQVWNLKTLYNDPVMYCTFALPEKKKIAFSASFTLPSLPTQYKNIIRNRLLEYSFIGVREFSGLNILKELDLPPTIVQKCTCDPTLLLQANEYDELAKDSSINIKDDYILIYALGYAFIPEPAMSSIIRIAIRHYKCKTVFLGDCHIEYKCDYTIPNNIGPCEFIYLIKNAKHVITSSFHGTMFSLIYRKNFTSILPNKQQKDNRIQDILTILGLQQYGIQNDNEQPNITFKSPYAQEIINKVNNYINESKQALNSALF